MYSVTGTRMTDRIIAVTVRAGCIIVFASGLWAWAQPATTDSAAMSDEERTAAIGKLEELIPLIEAVKKTPGNVELYKPLYHEAATMPNTVNVREPLCYTVALGLLYCGREEIFMKQKAALQSMYPNGRFSSYLDLEKYTGKCPFCEGTGQIQTLCPQCRGEKKCTNGMCQGGKITYRGTKGEVVKDCPICKGSGKCPLCHGEGTVLGKCDACGGSGTRKVQDQIGENVAILADDTLVAIRVRIKQLAGQAKLGTLNETGNQVTPPELKDRLKDFGQWMLNQQRRLETKIVIKAYALHEGSRAVLYLVMHHNFVEQDYDWRLSIAKACYMDWRFKCTQNAEARYQPGLVLLDEEDNKIGEFRAAEGRIWLPK